MNQQTAQPGSMVTFLAPSLHGPSKLAGTVKRILPDGRLEVKSQQHGYYILYKSEVTPWT